MRGYWASFPANRAKSPRKLGNGFRNLVMWSVYLGTASFADTTSRSLLNNENGFDIAGGEADGGYILVIDKHNGI
ncbi:hypothetical protein ACFLVS_06965 [Chloroflexota bacterium]